MMRAKKVFRNKKGMTLVEVVVALALTFILITVLGSLLVPVMTLHRNSESRMIMDTVGQKLLNEIAISAAGCDNLVLYSDANPTLTDTTKYKMYLNNGYIYKNIYRSKWVATPILVSEESYRNCKVVSFDLFAATIREQKSYDDLSMGNYVRILYARIKLSRNNVVSDYMITTIKIYNFSMTGYEIMDNTNKVANTNANPHTASSGYKSIIITPYTTS